jgi:VanZ family protein
MEQNRTFADTPFARIMPAAWVMATIWWLSDRETLPSPPGLTAEIWSYLGHIGIFGLLGLTIWWALGMNSQLLNRERNWYAIAIATAYGVLDEFHQSFVPGREASALDVLADFAGAALAVLIVPRLYRRWFG